MESEQVNNVISLFMGLKQSDISSKYWYSQQHGYTLPKYDKDWGWLMPAIIKAQLELKYVTGNDIFDLEKESKKLAKFLYETI